MAHDEDITRVNEVGMWMETIPDRVFKDDLKRFRARMRLREGGRCRVGIQTPELAAGAE